VGEEATGGRGTGVVVEQDEDVTHHIEQETRAASQGGRTGRHTFGVLVPSQ
jgi:hypothetical protein